MPIPKTIAFLDTALASRRNECIRWPYALRKGYPVFITKGKTISGHRYICEVAHGKAPTFEHYAAHLCGLRRCVNPRHIAWSTSEENATDRYIHGVVKLSKYEGRRKAAEERIAIRLLKHPGGEA
jgi:hypothetical protein